MEPVTREASPVENFFRFARNLYGEDLLENFLVTAVASVLVIRLFLQLTGYPQIGGSGLHLAHMLWGGLLMLIGLFLALGFLSRPAHEWAAVLGGTGFGAFIDELGKYITNDNNYFFQPTIAIIYVTFILIYLAIQAIYNRKPLTSQENLANAFELMKQGSINGLNSADEQTLREMLAGGDPANPLVKQLQEMLPHIGVNVRQPHPLNRFKRRVDEFYHIMITRWWFAGVVVAFFAFTAMTGFSTALGVIERPWSIAFGIAALSIILLAVFQFWKGHNSQLQIVTSGSVIAIFLLMLWIVIINRNKLDLPFADWAQFACSSLSALLIIAGIVLMGWQRLAAYQMFHRAILISLLLTTVFAFYEYQFYALIGVFLNTLILFALRYMINREKLSKARVPEMS